MEGIIEEYDDEAEIKELFRYYHDFFNHAGNLYDSFYKESTLPSNVERCGEACAMTADALRCDIEHDESFFGTSFGERWDKSGFRCFQA